MEPPHLPISEIIVGLQTSGKFFPCKGTKEFYRCRATKPAQGKDKGGKCGNNIGISDKSKEVVRDKIEKIKKLMGELQNIEENCDDCDCIGKLREYITLTHCYSHSRINLRKLSEHHPEKVVEEVEAKSDLTARLPFGQHKEEIATVKSRELSDSEVEEPVESIFVSKADHSTEQKISSENFVAVPVSLGNAISNDEIARQESGKKVKKEAVKEEPVDNSVIESIKEPGAVKYAIGFPEKTEADFADSMPYLPRYPGQLFGNSRLFLQEQPKARNNADIDDKSAVEPKPNDDKKEDVKPVLGGEEPIVAIQSLPDAPKEDPELVKEEFPEAKALPIAEGPVLVEPTLSSTLSSEVPTFTPKGTESDSRDLKAIAGLDAQSILKPEIIPPQEDVFSSLKEASKDSESSETEEQPNARDTQAKDMVTSSTTAPSTSSNATSEDGGDSAVDQPTGDETDVLTEAHVETEDVTCAESSESVTPEVKTVEGQQQEPTIADAPPVRLTESQVQPLEADYAETGLTDEESSPSSPPSSTEVIESATTNCTQPELSREGLDESDQEVFEALAERTEPKEERPLVIVPSERELNEDCEPTAEEDEAGLESSPIGDTDSTQLNDAAAPVSEEYGTITVSGSSNVTYRLEEYNADAAAADENSTLSIADDASYHFTSEEIGQINENWPQYLGTAPDADSTLEDISSPEPSGLFDENDISANDSLHSQLTPDSSYIQEPPINEHAIKRKPVNSQPNRDSLLKVPSISDLSRDMDANNLDTTAPQNAAKPRSSIGGDLAEKTHNVLTKVGLRKSASFTNATEEKKSSKLFGTVKNANAKFVQKTFKHVVPDRAKDADDLLEENLPKDWKTMRHRVEQIYRKEKGNYKERAAELKSASSVAVNRIG